MASVSQNMQGNANHKVLQHIYRPIFRHKIAIGYNSIGLHE